MFSKEFGKELGRMLVAERKALDERAAADRVPTPEGLVTKAAWEVFPDEIREWVLHLDLHLTEHDDAHARKALRAAWPAVREYLLFVVSHRIEMVGDLQRANAVGARYRWLREIRNQGSKSQDGEGLMVVRDRPSTVPRYIGPIFGDELDKRIDEGLAAPADPYLNHVPPTTVPANSVKGER